MANREITGNDFMNQGYSTLPLDTVLKEYQTKEIAPDRIFSRFQNLENQLDMLEAIQGDLAEQRVSDLGDFYNKYSEMFSILGIVRDDLKEAEGDKKKCLELVLSALKERAKKQAKEAGYSFRYLEKVGKEEEAMREKVMEFQREYAQELRSIYTHSPRIVDEDFVFARLARANSRASETSLIAESRVIPQKVLFSSEYLDFVDRVSLAKATLSSGEYVLDLDVLADYVSTSPDRISRLAQTKDQVDANYSQVQELLREFNALYPIAYERSREGPDKDI